MRAWQIFAAGLTGILLGVVVVLVFQRPPPTPELMYTETGYQELVNKLDAQAEGRGRLEDKLAQLSSEVMRLRGDLRALQSDVQQMAPMPLDPDPAQATFDGAEDDPWAEEVYDPADTSDPEEAAEEKLATQRERENQARLERHDAIHEQETVDPYWARKTTQKINEAFRRTELPASRISDVDCRATRCRVVMIHADQAAHQAFQQSLTTPSGMSSVLPRAIFSHFELDEGSVETVMILYQKSLRSGS